MDRNHVKTEDTFLEVSQSNVVTFFCIRAHHRFTVVHIKAGDDVPHREALTDLDLGNVVHLQAVAHACHQVFLSCPADYKKNRIIPGTV